MSKQYLCINNKLKYETKGPTPKYVEKSSTIVLNQKCIRNGIVDYSFSQFLSEQQNIPNEKYVKIGDILLNSTGQGTAGRCALVDYIPENYKVTIDSHMLILRFENIEFARFFAYSLFNQENFILELLTGSSGQGELDREIVYNISFPYNNKNLAIFNKILVLINNKIKLNSKINTILEKIAKNLYDYWFVQFDFPDENNQPYKSSGGKMVYNDILKREIPIDWKVKELQLFCNIFTGKKDVKMANNKGLYHFFSCAPEPLKSDEYICDAEAILVAGNGSYTGRVTYYNGKFDLYQRTYACTLKDNADKIMPFLYFYMKFFFEPHFKGGTHGSAIPYIVLGDLTNLGIPFDSNIIFKFVQIVTPILKEIFCNNEANQNLSELREFLLPMLMNGQVTVSDKIENNLSEEKIIEKSLEFWKTHGKMDIDKFARENGILVYKDNEQKKGAVSYNAEKDLYEIAVKDPRDNFTIAHEIGHILKHKKELKTGTLGRKSEESGSKIMEYEADFLAAEILMPEEYVMKYLKEYKISNKDYLDEKFVKSCAKKFDVTPPAMNIRLKNLGYKVPYLK